MRPSIEAQKKAVEVMRPPAPQQEQPRASVLDHCQPPANLEETIRAASARERLADGLLRAVIRQESAFDPCAYSAKGAMGLMQLMPATAADMGVADPFDPRENVSGGARFLRLLLDRYQGNLPLALGAYNAGPGRVDAFGTIPPIPETLAYVRRILRHLNSQPR